MKYECHGHIISDGVSYKDSMARHKNGIDEQFIRHNLKLCAQDGISFYRDGGDKLMVSAAAKRLAGEYEIDYRSPIYIIHKSGYYGQMYGRAFDDLKAFARLVKEAKSLGADFIKITVSGMLDFNNNGRISGPSMNYGELCEMVNISIGEGFSVMAHVNGSDNIKNALSAGVKSIEHGYWPDRDVIDYFLQTGAVWVPTCAPVHNLIGAGRFPDGVLKSVLEAQRQVLVEAYKRGVPIAAGSDCGAFMVPHGKGTEDEYRILSEMGIEPERGNRAIEEIFKVV